MRFRDITRLSWLGSHSDYTWPLSTGDGGGAGEGVLMAVSTTSSRCCLGVGAPGHSFFLSCPCSAHPPFPLHPLQVRQGQGVRQNSSSSRYALTGCKSTASLHTSVLCGWISQVGGAAGVAAQEGLTQPCSQRPPRLWSHVAGVLCVCQSNGSVFVRDSSQVHR